MRYVVKLTMEQAVRLGIVKCASCGYPKNNHFDFGKKVCAHSVVCTGWKTKFVVGRSLAKSKKPAKKPPIRQTG